MIYYGTEKFNAEYVLHNSCAFSHSFPDLRDLQFLPRSDSTRFYNSLSQAAPANWQSGIPNALSIVEITLHGWNRSPVRDGTNQCTA